MPRSVHRLLGGLIVGAVVLAGCATSAEPAVPGQNSGNWSSVLDQAGGQTVNWYTYGGDDTLNAFIDGYVADHLKPAGVTMNHVKVADTADALNTVLGEKQAGKSNGGSVDAIWLNGKNFATGVQAGLWYCGWDRDLPNSRFVDFASPAVASDFGVPVNGCESVWQQANSALVYDSAALTPHDVESVSSLFDWARAHPGRFTYPAPPDFTGSMAVRRILYDTIGGPSSLAGPFDQSKYTSAADRLWQRLNDIAPALWRGGSTYPQTQTAVEKLYGDGQISAFFTYGPGAVGDKVAQGRYPATTREAVLAGGNIANDNFIAIPANAAHKAAALVLANLLQDPQTQLALYRAEGIYPSIDVTRTSPQVRAEFDAVPPNATVLPLQELSRQAQPELASTYVNRLDADWKTNVLQR